MVLVSFDREIGATVWGSILLDENEGVQKYENKRYSVTMKTASNFQQGADRAGVASTIEKPALWGQRRRPKIMVYRC